jgi:hypothetical protein
MFATAERTCQGRRYVRRTDIRRSSRPPTWPDVQIRCVVIRNDLSADGDRFLSNRCVRFRYTFRSGSRFLGRHLSTRPWLFDMRTSTVHEPPRNDRAVLTQLAPPCSRHRWDHTCRWWRHSIRASAFVMGAAAHSNVAYKRRLPWYGLTLIFDLKYSSIG